MMTHPTEETLNDYLERELTPAEHVRVATHLETCSECALIVAELQQIVREASSLGPVDPPEHVWTLIQSRVQSPEFRVQSPESTVQSPESTVQSPQPKVQS